MSAARPAPVAHNGDVCTSRSALLATRLLISSYFVVVGLCLIEDPVLYTFLIPGHLNSFASQSLQLLVILAASLIMLARFVRPAALFLIVFTMASAGIHFGSTWSGDSLESLWREVSLIGALLMIALTARPVILDLTAIFGKRPAVTPRRVKLDTSGLPASLLAEVEDDDEVEEKDAQPQLERGEISNLFHDLWEDTQPIRTRPGTA
ncbi:hypothetical protein [Anianabacter salinae]|uniref:hypothetical protein n=1 Tax=Anianabacter salinae TaxID=2851023 RepID=UPI00225E1C5D|nr:hypothetical protein [Anianabacter salinae]MBV0912047.1 hypothetical protein [Anianabacter salinae]